MKFSPKFLRSSNFLFIQASYIHDVVIDTVLGDPWLCVLHGDSFDTVVLRAEHGVRRHLPTGHRREVEE